MLKGRRAKWEPVERTTATVMILGKTAANVFNDGTIQPERGNTRADGLMEGKEGKDTILRVQGTNRNHYETSH